MFQLTCTRASCAEFEQLAYGEPEVRERVAFIVTVTLPIVASAGGEVGERTSNCLMAVSKHRTSFGGWWRGVVNYWDVKHEPTCKFQALDLAR